jgi:hypothetical protein
MRPPCPTASSPSNPMVLSTGELLPPGGTQAVVGNRAPRSPKRLRSQCDRIRLRRFGGHPCRPPPEGLPPSFVQLRAIRIALVAQFPT